MVSVETIQFTLLNVTDGDEHYYRLLPDIHPDDERSMSMRLAMRQLCEADDPVTYWENAAPRSALVGKVAATLFSKIMIVFPDTWQMKVSTAIQAYLDALFDVDVTKLTLAELRTIARYLASTTTYLPLRDLGLLALADDVSSAIAHYLQYGDVPEYFDHYSQIGEFEVDNRTIIATATSIRDIDVPSPFRSTNPLLIKQPSIVLSSSSVCVDDSDGVQITRALRNASTSIIYEYMKKAKEGFTPTGLTFFKHSALSDHVIALPEDVCEYVINNVTYTMRPIVHEFFRRCMVHLRLFCRMKREVEAPSPFDVVLPLDPAMVVGKSIVNDGTAFSRKAEKLVVLFMAMYTQGQIPKELFGWSADMSLYPELQDSKVSQLKGTHFFSDASLFESIVDSIDRWVDDSVIGKPWHKTIFYNSRMSMYLQHSRIGGGESKIVVDDPLPPLGPKLASIIEYPPLKVSAMKHTEDDTAVWSYVADALNEASHDKFRLSVCSPTPGTVAPPATPQNERVDRGRSRGRGRRGNGRGRRGPRTPGAGNRGH
jgi:hypothetical protein